MSFDTIVSIVVEMGTREITHQIAPETCAKHFIEEARSFLSDDQFEIYFVGCNVPPIEGLIPNCHVIDACGTGYYGWKNIGAQAARGRYIVFWDSDCRPKPGYLKEAVDALEKNRSLSGLTGATQYDGGSFFTQLNTILSFGFLHQKRETLGRFCPMGHNIVIRKSMFSSSPFGPHRARAGGAHYLAQTAKAMNKPLQHNHELKIFHEDISFSLKATLEQHLREIYIGVLGRSEISKWMKMWTGLKALPLVCLKRVWRVFKYRKPLQFGWIQTLLSIPVLLAYAVLDALTVFILSLCPPLLDRWVKYQFQEIPVESVHETAHG